MIPSRQYVATLPRRHVEQRIIDFHRSGFPRFGESGAMEEVALLPRGWPDKMECGGFAFGSLACGTLAKRPVEDLWEVARQMTLMPLSTEQVLAERGREAIRTAGAIIAVYAKDDMVAHFALGFPEEDGALPRAWLSKFGPGPILQHGEVDLAGGDYGEVVAYILCPEDRVGSPAWASSPTDDL